MAFLEEKHAAGEKHITLSILVGISPDWKRPDGALATCLETSDQCVADAKANYADNRADAVAAIVQRIRHRILDKSEFDAWASFYDPLPLRLTWTCWSAAKSLPELQQNDLACKNWHITLDVREFLE